MVLSHVISIDFLKTEVGYVDFGEAIAKSSGGNVWWEKRGR